MAQNASQSTDEESLKTLFDEAMKMYDKIENGNEATNSDAVQLSIKATIGKFEKATNLVSLSGMFSKNEDLEELPTETLQYLLLPALLGTLTLKLCGQPRKGVIQVAEIYFRDFLQRCKDYGVTDVEVPQTMGSESTSRQQTEQANIANMVLSRQAKIKRYKEMKELKEKLSTLSKAMSSPTADDATKREYFVTMLLDYVNQALEELSSIEQEKPILEYMAKKGINVFKPNIVCYRFPGSGSNIPHATIQNADADPDEAEQMRKERLVEDDDPEEVARQRSMDEYKDDHRRGWGNRHNRS
ncbi:jg10976 [Pararge aegeria aegeria]|uniref:Jg10976 protein n=1 Tax=Pararge aegeria aegeria TaxID=348720 RepID=A0A8S4SH58_9NEOP|nr:jg10976 [Pararge aegeria aegeria]